MTLIVHHLGVSQSERIVWLCEELGLDYELRKYERSPYLAPPELTALHPLGAAPVIEDTDKGIKLAESGACVEYIAQTYGGGRLILKPDHPDYADYLYWFHFVNGSLHPAFMRDLALKAVGVTSLPSASLSSSSSVDKEGEENPVLRRFAEKLKLMMGQVEDRLADPKVEWIAGAEFTAADVMLGFSLTTSRCFVPCDLGDYPNILKYLGRVSKREGYVRSRERGDPELDIELLAAASPPPSFQEVRQKTKQ